MKTTDRPTASNTPNLDHALGDNPPGTAHERFPEVPNLALPVLQPKRRDLLARAADRKPTRNGADRPTA